MTPWFSASTTTAQQLKQTSIKPLTVHESIHHLNPPKPVKNVRFSSLLLEYGELIVQDWAVALSSVPLLKQSATRQSVRNSTKHKQQPSRRKKSKSFQQQQKEKTTSLQMMQGRLHLCTQSLVFEPLDVMRPILRFPFAKMPLLPHEVTSPSSTNNDNDDESYEIPLTIRFESMRHVRIKENNVIGPFEIVDVSEKYTLTFLHSSPQTSFCQLCQKLADLVVNSRNNESFLEAILKPMYHRPFRVSNLMPLDHPVTPSLPVQIISPLQKQRGCCLITSTQRLYYQVANYFGNQSPIQKSWSLAPLNWVAYARRYEGLRDTAVEWYWKDGTSILLSFESTSDREKAIQAAIMVHGGKNNFGNHDINSEETTSYKQKSKKNNIAPPRCLTNPDFMQEALQEWQADRLSNYDYLMACNVAAGRTFHDWSRYPVFPWVLKDYTSDKLDFNDPMIYRDFSKAMGALNEERLAYFEARLSQLSSVGGGNDDVSTTQPISNSNNNDDSCAYEDASISMRFLYGTHYSAPGYILYYLVRCRPEHMLCLQNGKFDTPDRMFHSMQHCWNCALTNHADVKELIPEFYRQDSIVDVLWNAQSLQLGATQLGERVHHVDLPPWANQSPRKFGRYLRKALESDIVSARLPQWIDLIFGYKSRGVPAQEAKNWFHPCSYLGPEKEETKSPSKQTKKSLGFLQMELQAVEFGIVPDQLFNKAHPNKNTATIFDKGDSVFHPTLGKIAAYPNDPTIIVAEFDSTNKETWELLEPPQVSSSLSLPSIGEKEENSDVVAPLHVSTQEVNNSNDNTTMDLVTPRTKASESWVHANSIQGKNHLSETNAAKRNHQNFASLALSGSGDLTASTTLHQGFGGINNFKTTNSSSGSHSSSPKENDIIPSTSNQQQQQLSCWDMKLLEKNSIHGDAITACSLAPNSTNNSGYITTVSLDGSLLVHTIQDHIMDSSLSSNTASHQQQARRSFMDRLYSTERAPKQQQCLTTPHRRFHDGSDPLACLSITQDVHGGHLVFTGGHDDVVLAYGITSSCAVASVYSHRDAVTGLHVLENNSAATSYSHVMVSGSWDATVKVWSVAVSAGETVSITREPLAELFDADSTIVCLSAIFIEQDALAIAVGCSDGSLVVWMCHMKNGTKVVIYKDKPARSDINANQACAALQWSQAITGETVLFAGFGSGRIMSFVYNGSDDTFTKSSAVSIGVPVQCLVSASDFVLVGCADGGLRLLPILAGSKFHQGQRPTLWNNVHGSQERGKGSASITCCSLLQTKNNTWLGTTGAEDGSLVL
eukprot:CAMPEP_0194248144 /NCGR_PEP_ID=MMETSP0158-20130606/17690_1 /TAXON_ID=33649 /ORGANISM="Thalassionema nitzschioides, Strain L26-B" /LENGTH=1284 /DNA_ID=CAMNT_0038984355 /DNA_START=239 /DNA_END=4090 /DNA_ORIENTATION=+